MFDNYYDINGKRDPRIKILQIEDLENQIKEITHTKTVKEGILSIIEDYIEQGNLYGNKYGAIIELLNLKIKSKLHKDEINDGAWYSYQIKKYEDIQKQKLRRRELYSIEEITQFVFRKNFGNCNGRYCNHNKDLENIFAKQENIIEQLKAKYINNIYKKCDINDIKKSIVMSQVNGLNINLIFSKCTGTEGEFEIFKNFKCYTKIQREAFVRAFEHIKNEHGVILKNGHIKPLSIDEKIEMLELFYNNDLRNIIDKYKNEFSLLEKVRRKLMINTHLWNKILRRYEIEKPNKIYNQDGIQLDSEEELIIDNFFRENNIEYYKYNYEKHKDKHGFHYDKNRANNRYEPDWIINENIIVEYFGFLDTDTKKYTQKTIEKIRYYRQLRDYYLIDIYPENLNNLDQILKIIKKFD